MKIGNRDFDTENHTYVMGILNVTPDSFSDGGKYNTLDQALLHAEQMVKEGVDIIDVGGESTRPGFQIVPAEEEIERVLPVIKAIKKNYNIPVSLDTWKAEVAVAAVAEGVDIINDISCLKEKKMAEIVAKSGCAYCLMHNREKSGTDENNPFGYCTTNPELVEEYVEEVLSDMQKELDYLYQAGVAKEQIMVDPGVGFAKSYEQNIMVLNQLAEFHRFDLPILLGTSRKSVIGLTLDVPVQERMEGTLATSVYAVMTKCGFVRVHDVQANVRAIRMMEAILQG